MLQWKRKSKAAVTYLVLAQVLVKVPLTLEALIDGLHHLVVLLLVLIHVSGWQLDIIILKIWSCLNNPKCVRYR